MTAEDDSDLDSQRTCIVTRSVCAPESMIRFVLDPQNRVVPDIRRRLPGRGVWVGARRMLVARAVRERAFARGFKKPVEVAEDLPSTLDRLLEADALQVLAFANKAGLAVAGAAKVEAAIAKGALAALVHASDGGGDGLRKMRQAARRASSEAGAQLPVVSVLTSAQLGLALGRTNVIHAAVKKGPASEAFVARCTRLAAYRDQTSEPTDMENAAPPVGLNRQVDGKEADLTSEKAAGASERAASMRTFQEMTAGDGPEVVEE